MRIKRSIGKHVGVPFVARLDSEHVSESLPFQFTSSVCLHICITVDRHPTHPSRLFVLSTQVFFAFSNQIAGMRAFSSIVRWNYWTSTLVFSGRTIMQKSSKCTHYRQTEVFFVLFLLNSLVVCLGLGSRERAWVDRNLLVGWTAYVW